MIWLKLSLALLGLTLFFFGTYRALWEVYSWGKLAELGERPALVGRDTRVCWKAELILAILGAFLFTAAFLI